MKNSVIELAVKYIDKEGEHYRFADDAMIRDTVEVMGGKATGRTITTIVYVSEGVPRESRDPQDN